MDGKDIIEKYLNDNGFEDLKDYEGIYKINKRGELWSCWYSKIMSPHLKENYLYIHLSNNGVRKHTSIHRLLASQYIPNPNNYDEIDHIDRNPQNNNLENLRWANKYIQNNNKSNCLALKTEEELKERGDKIREYKRLWAENNRREKGIPVKEAKPAEVIKEINNARRREKLANMTEEEHKIHLQKRRENYAKIEKTEEFKLKAIIRAKKAVEQKKQQKLIEQN